MHLARCVHRCVLQRQGLRRMNFCRDAISHQRREALPIANLACIGLYTLCVKGIDVVQPHETRYARRDAAC